MTAPFAIKRIRRPLAIRHLTVSAVTRIAPTMARVTLVGDELAGFEAPGPADHVKAFFPGPDGVLAVPTITDDGLRQPETGPVHARDYTPLEFRPDGDSGPELDIDFVLHGDDGPASLWASNAKPGDPFVFGGPRGSVMPPEGAEQVIVAVDETGLPAARRFFQFFLPDVPVIGLFSLADAELRTYLDDIDGGERHWFTGGNRSAELEEKFRTLKVTDRTFLFLAGEAGAIVPLRRYMRRELGLPREQFDASGYWKQGVVNLDHHAPLDPSDPE